MLDRSDVRDAAGFCSRIGCDVILPEEWRDYFHARGKLPDAYDDRRRFVRFHLRCKAVLWLDGQTFAVYMKDLSRCGVSFLHAAQLLPDQQCIVILPNGALLRLQVVRSRRIGLKCYDCGAIFRRKA